MARILGITALSHDASVTVLDDETVVFAAHAERYSRTKNDPHLNPAILDAALAFGPPDRIVWYEKPLIKKTRQLAAAQWGEALTLSDLPRRYLKAFGLHRYPLSTVPHHLAHAMAGVATCPFDDAAVLIVDAIGEWNTLSLGEWRNGTFDWFVHSNYPNSLGLLYTAFTQRCGLKPNEEEFILMGMAAYGEPIHADAIRRDFVEGIDDDGHLHLKENLHGGLGAWQPDARNEDIAASIQAVTEDLLMDLVHRLAARAGSKNLVYMGGVALNCVANERIAHFWSGHAGRTDAIWIMPNPGDAGSSLGAAALVHGGKVDWRGPYLGTDIDGELDIDRIVSTLEAGQVMGIAHGRAEFGPRALGNRSLISDPRGPDMKDRVNVIKKRDAFRPFAPVVLEEHAAELFDMPVARSPYMQFTAPCKQPDVYPGICHVDGSSRVQTITAEQNPVFHTILAEFHRRTGCPAVLNTSLNIKGEPLVDTRAHGAAFAAKHGVPVFSGETRS